jgi:hypothetical protein
MVKPAYMETGVDADLARLIKDGAIFIRPVGSTAPTGTSWTPTDSETQVGYYSDDGYVLTPVPGDETNLTGHNGDPLISESAPGWWTVGFSGLEGNEVVTSTYFDVDVAPDGSVTVSKAAASRRYDVITVGLDQKDRLILVHYPNVQIDNSSREGVTFNRTTLLAMGLTFRTFKGGAAAPYHFKAWGLVADGKSAEWSLEITGSPTGGTYTLSVDGVASAAIAYDANATAVASALNAISGVTGTTVTGTTTKTITFTAPRALTADGSALTGGTSPAAVVSAV